VLRSTRHRFAAASVAAILLAALLCMVAGPAAGSGGPHAAPYAGPALIYYADGVNATSLAQRLGVTISEDYGSFALAALSATQREWLGFEGITVQPLPDLTRIYLRSADLDTSVGEPPLDPDLMNPNTGPGWYLVQFKGPVRSQWQTELQAAGEVVGYYPNYTYLAYLSAQARGVVPTWGFVNWVGPFHPAYRLQLNLGDGQYLISLFPGRAGQATLDKLTNLGLTVLDSYGTTVLAEGPRPTPPGAAWYS